MSEAFEPELCIYCRKKVADTRDHVVPLAYGKRNFTVPCCLECNMRIGDRTYYTFEERRAAAVGSLVIRRCLICDEEMEDRIYRIYHRKYCSDECAGIAKRAKKAQKRANA